MVNAEINVLSPIETQFGFHFLEVLDKELKTLQILQLKTTFWSCLRKFDRSEYIAPMQKLVEFKNLY